MYDISLRGIRKPVQIRFHPDDIRVSLGVLSTFMPAHSITCPEDWQQAEEAFSRALITLDTAMRVREQEEFNAEDRRRTAYFQAREKEANQ